MERRRLNRSTVLIAVVALMIGLALGSVFSTRTMTLTTTQLTTTTRTIPYQVTQSSYSPPGNEAYPSVTLTAVIVDVYYYYGVCTTISGTPAITYTNGPGGQLTTVVTVYSASLPQQYIATVTTDYTSISNSATTQPYAGSC